MPQGHTLWDPNAARLSGLGKRLRRKSDAELARRSLPGAAGQLVAALMLGWTTRIFHDHPAAGAALLSALTCLGLLRLWLVLRIRRIYGSRPLLWRRAMTGCFFLSGLAWGIVSAVGVTGYGYESWNSFLLSIAIIGLSSLGVISMTPNFTAMCLYVLAILIPNVSAHLARGGVEGNTMVALDTLLGAFLLAQGRRLNRHLYGGLRANLELRMAKLAAEQAARAKDAAIVALAVSEEHYRQLFNRHPHPMWVFDKDTLRFLDVNDAAVRHYGYSRDEFLNLSLAQIRPPDELPKFLEEINIRRPALHSSGPWKHRKKGGSLIDVEVAAHDLTFGGKRARLAVAVDVTERERSRRLERDRRGVLESIAQSRPLHEIMRKLLDMLEHQAPGIAVSVMLWQDNASRCIASSLPPEVAVAACGTARGLAADDAPELRRRHTMIGDSETDPFWRALRRTALQAGFHACWSIPILGGSKELLGAFAVCTREMEPLGETEVQLMEIAGQIASVAIERHQLHDKLLFQAHHDPLTGLPNRFLFDDRLRQALARARRGGNCVALLHIDLDRFKLINDILGHAMGDLLLKAVAGRLQNGIRESDTLARVGGDEFTLILADMHNPADALAIAEQLRGALLAPFDIGGHELFVTVCIGIALYPQDATDAGLLVRKADAAMYMAKNSGKNRVQCFAPEMDPVGNRLELESHLHRALERNELEVYYQPLFETAGRKLAAMEALLRWRHPRLGLVPPSHFISIAEETGLIVPIGDWIMRQACRQLVEWKRGPCCPERISVNVSAIQFTRDDFIESVSAALAETGLEPSALQLEITESVIMRDMDVSARQMAELRQLGISIAVDDFGTGYSSLSYLQRLPVDCIKIDRSFVRDIGVGTAPPRLLQAIVMMAHSLGMKVTAEGIETGQQLAVLRALGCDYVQGFYLGRPAPRPDPSQLAVAASERDVVLLAS